MRVLLPDDRCGEMVAPDPSESLLRELYAHPSGRWLRANMVSTLDGAATGPDGLSGSISSDADKRVFGVLRTLADVVLVGAGTVRAERYAPEEPPAELAALRTTEGRRPAPPFAVVTRSCDVPAALFEPGLGTLVVTCTAAGPSALARLRDLAGDDGVVVAGDEAVDIPRALDALAERGLRHVLCEGGPTLLSEITSAGALDELCLTTSPVIATGVARRIDVASVPGPGLRVAPALLLGGHDGSLIGRWVISRPAS